MTNERDDRPETITREPLLTGGPSGSLIRNGGNLSPEIGGRCVKDFKDGWESGLKPCPENDAKARMCLANARWESPRVVSYWAGYTAATLTA